jgi:hypothetical protein
MAANNSSIGAHLSGSRRLGASLRQVGLTGQRVPLVSPTIHDVTGIYHPPISELRMFSCGPCQSDDRQRLFVVLTMAGFRLELQGGEVVVVLSPPTLEKA